MYAIRLEAADQADRLHEVSSALAGKDPDWVPERVRLDELLADEDAEEETSNVVQIAAFVNLVNRGMRDG